MEAPLHGVERKQIGLAFENQGSERLQLLGTAMQCFWHSVLCMTGVNRYLCDLKQWEKTFALVLWDVH